MKYAKISDQVSLLYIKRRKQLIDLVLHCKNGILQASKVLKIKLATAKHIIKVFRKSGKILQKKQKKTAKKAQTSE
jgi:hypothetical protein